VSAVSGAGVALMLRVEFFPRDLWVGVFIGEREPDVEGYYRTIYVCPLPMLVVSFDVRVKREVD
jgi:hypothetical protein